MSLGFSGVSGFTGVHPRGRRDRPPSLCSLGYAIGFDGFIRGRWIVWGHPGGRRVRPGSLVSLGCALGSSGSSGFIGVCPLFRRVHLGSFGSLWCGRWVSLGSLGCALGVIGFTVVVGLIEMRPEGGRRHPAWLRSLGCALGVIQFVRSHWGALGGSSGSSLVTRFIRVCPWGRRVHPRLLGCAMVFVGSSGVAWIIGVRPGGRRVHPGSPGSLGYSLGVIGFVLGRRVYWGAPWGSSGSSGVTWLFSWGHRVRPGSTG